MWSVEEVDGVPVKNVIKTASSEDVIAITSIDEKIAELETQLTQLKDAYQQSQKYNNYIFICLLLVLIVVGIIALFY